MVRQQTNAMELIEYELTNIDMLYSIYISMFLNTREDI